MRRYLAAALSTVLTASFVTCLTIGSADAAHHRYRACPRCCLDGYCYVTDHEIAGDQLVLKAELLKKLERKEDGVIVNILRFHVSHFFKFRLHGSD